MKRNQLTILNPSDRYFELHFALPWSDLVIVPLNTRLASAELDFMIADSGASAIFLDDAHMPMLEAMPRAREQLRTIISLSDARPAHGIHYEDLIAAHAPGEDMAGGGEALAGIFYSTQPMMGVRAYNTPFIHGLQPMAGSGLQEWGDRELKNFRQLGSPTAGHPEYGHAAGIETTTGPLGQGISNSVGLALAERMWNARLGDIVDHFTYTIASDGDLQEGVASEACSLAGHLGLGRLIAFYDDNHISIEGSTDLAFCEQVADRCRRVRRSAQRAFEPSAVRERVGP